MCTQFCGTDHARMIGHFVVMTPDEYARWSAAQPETDDLARKGSRLFVSFGCSGCHAPGSRVHAPDLHGLYGRQIPLDGGGIVTADEAYIRDCILLNKHIPAGYPPVMPHFQGVVTRTISSPASSLTSGRCQPDGRDIAMTDTTIELAPAAEPVEKNYLNDETTLWSWLTTTDHKRIGILYTLSITSFFFIGGVAIGIVRLELLTPHADVVSAEAYNRLFSYTVSSWSGSSWCRRSRRHWAISFCP